MRTVAIAGRKGGTGKTTTAVNLAAWLARLGRPVLLVDLDPQANATLHLGAASNTSVWRLLVRQDPLAELAGEVRPSMHLLHGGEHHEYIPDFLVRLKHDGWEVGTLILETKGYDELATVKEAAARRWVKAVNADGRYGLWWYAMVYDPTRTPAAVRDAARRLAAVVSKGPVSPS